MAKKWIMLEFLSVFLQQSNVANGQKDRNRMETR